MYKKFKDCLLKPSRISNYLDDSKGKTLLFFILLLFIYILPSLVSIISVNKMPSTYSNYITESFKNSEKINYELENFNGKTILTKTDINAKPQYVDLGYVLNANIKTFLLFNTEENFNIKDYNFPNELANQTVILLILDTEGVAVTIGLIDETSVNNEVDKLASNLNAYGLFIKYDNLGLEKLDFSLATTNVTSFRNELNEAYIDIYNSNKILIYIFLIPIVIATGIVSLILQILFVSLIFKIMYRRYELGYKTLCKIVLLSYTPCVVFNLLSIFYSSLLMYFVGEILTVAYISIALKHAFIKKIGIDLNKIINKQNSNEGDE